MKQSVLLTLLPILAALSPLSITGVTAHGHHHHHHSSSTSTPQRTTTHRKTLGFGLSHPHADYKVLSPDESDILATRISAIALRSLKEVEGQSDDFVTTNVIQGGKSDQLDQIARKVAIEFVKMFIVGSEKGDDVKSFFIRDDVSFPPSFFSSSSILDIRRSPDILLPMSLLRYSRGPADTNNSPLPHSVLHRQANSHIPHLPASNR